MKEWEKLKFDAIKVLAKTMVRKKKVKQIQRSVLNEDFKEHHEVNAKCPARLLKDTRSGKRRYKRRQEAYKRRNRRIRYKVEGQEK
ncbi:hypothetical protein RirG_197000 [Rhizophagus irregularis DAOM 197198w]|uniref:Uncharacterized protein n=2 Tax=Rhizophagus irregularis TaxID=588596 RepID=A0A015IMV9_RHIIW|nr:hypothetical protein RirG_197000 [Rhizophagus irregularis DAOM 197198w]